MWSIIEDMHIQVRLRQPSSDMSFYAAPLADYAAILCRCPGLAAICMARHGPDS